MSIRSKFDLLVLFDVVVFGHPSNPLAEVPVDGREVRDGRGKNPDQRRGVDSRLEAQLVRLDELRPRRRRHDDVVVDVERRLVEDVRAAQLQV